MTRPAFVEDEVAPPHLEWNRVPSVYGVTVAAPRAQMADLANSA